MKKLLEKLKNVNWKGKKAIISYIIAFVVLLSGTGITAIALNNQNHNIIENNSTSEDNHSSTTSDKETSDETNKEENSKEENSNLSDNNSSNNSNSSNSTSQSNSSVDNNTANSTNNKPSNNNNTTSKPSKPSNNTNTSNNNKPSNNNNSSNTNTKPTHTHSWQPQYQTINHAEQGHNEQVLVKPAWTEEIPRYETQIKTICNEKTCKQDFTGWQQSDVNQHIKEHLLNGENGGYHNEAHQIIVGYDKIEHSAQYENRWVVDTPAWTEQKLIGYICSCGATK